MRISALLEWMCLWYVGYVGHTMRLSCSSCAKCSHIHGLWRFYWIEMANSNNDILISSALSFSAMSWKRRKNKKKESIDDVECDYRRGLDWWMDLLTSYTHDSELQEIIATPLISAIHKSPQHPLSFFHPAVSSQAVPWQRLLTVAILQLHALRSHIHNLPYGTQLSWILSLITSRHGLHRKDRSSVVTCVYVAGEF
jgi:hypothetical protein